MTGADNETLHAAADAVYAAATGVYTAVDAQPWWRRLLRLPDADLRTKTVVLEGAVSRVLGLVEFGSADAATKHVTHALNNECRRTLMIAYRMYPRLNTRGAVTTPEDLR